MTNTQLYIVSTNPKSGYQKKGSFCFSNQVCVGLKRFLIVSQSKIQLQETYQKQRKVNNQTVDKGTLRY